MLPQLPSLRSQRYQLLLWTGSWWRLGTMGMPSMDRALPYECSVWRWRRSARWCDVHRPAQLISSDTNVWCPTSRIVIPQLCGGRSSPPGQTTASSSLRLLLHSQELGCPLETLLSTADSISLNQTLNFKLQLSEINPITSIGSFYSGKFKDRVRGGQ